MYPAFLVRRFDGDGECHLCEVSLDEDEMGMFLRGWFDNRPYYRSDNEYEVVKKQN